MNKWTLAACVLAITTFLVHLIGGEITVHRPTLDAGLNSELAAYASVLWHMGSAALLLNAIGLYFAARNAQAMRGLTLLIIAQYGTFAGIFVIYGISRFGNLWFMPQWSILLAVAVLAAIGLRKEETS